VLAESRVLSALADDPRCHDWVRVHGANIANYLLRNLYEVGTTCRRATALRQERRL